ncbi:ubiquitin-related domain-containing protein [Lineolata rhizophorae]|uniref:Ubiquitin-related domain-containing protein n=1 Tax=Lineolata rhizophorae TaxID=578093 RepID=A0A6A6PC03_9PEZI|nr:ubiquitin-related domain-containing protein [Lineolata rhizophorae]
MASSDLGMLIDMGFDKERASIAVKRSGGCSSTSKPSLMSILKRGLTASAVQGAIDWLEQNQDKSLDEIQAEEASSSAAEPALQSGEEARSLVCNECGKKFRSTAQAEFHASKTEHTDFSESTEEIKPLTEEEKKQKLEDLRAKLAAKRSGMSQQDKEDKKKNEVRTDALYPSGESAGQRRLCAPQNLTRASAKQEIRRKATRESQDVREDLQRKEQLKQAQARKREKQEEIEARKRVQARIEADKAERRRKAEAEKAARAGQATPAEPAAAPRQAPAAAAAAAASSSKPAHEYTETRLRLQTPGGTMTKSFPVETTLFEVAQAIAAEHGLEVQSFTQNFPKKVFDATDFGMTLKEAGMVPSSALIVR